MDSNIIHLDLDGAWPKSELADLGYLDLQSWGPQLRFTSPLSVVEAFFDVIREEIGTVNFDDPNGRFLVYGSGDFHHLSALWVRRLTQEATLVSFDNHPDWDIRPPMWCCGSWINRALDLNNIEHVAVWGCGNFETWGWHRLTGNHRDVRSGRLEVHAWADHRSKQDQARPHAILRSNWRDRFAEFVKRMPCDRSFYVTIDMDCLCMDNAATNWEQGTFTLDDIVWALEQLKAHAPILAGDICGAYSEPQYARWRQRFASEMDHPKLPIRDAATRNAVNLASLRRLLPILAGGT